MNLFSFLLQQTTTPDTSAYMVLGYSVIFGVIALYLISLLVRYRSTKQEYQLLSELEKPGEQ